MESRSSVSPTPPTPVREPGSTREQGPSEPRDVSLTRRVMRSLVRLSALLIVGAILFLFRGVLLPFAFAILFAYLIFPIVYRLERIHVRSHHLPRWVAILLVYALIFTVGRYTVPRAIVSLAAEIGLLPNSIPGEKQFQDWRKRGEKWLIKQLEVKELEQISKDEIWKASGLLMTREPIPAVPANVPSIREEMQSPSTEKDKPPESPASGVGFQIFGVNIYFGDARRDRPIEPFIRLPDFQSPAVPANDGDGPEDSSASSASSNGTTDSGDAGTIESSSSPAANERPTRFSDQAREQFVTALQERINKGLNASGPAKPILEEIGRWVDELNSHLMLPESDGELDRFKQLVRHETATAISREEYASLVMENVQKGLIAGREWLVQQLGHSVRLLFAIFGLIFEFFLVLMLCAFFLIFFPKIRDYVRELIPPRYREDYHVILKRIDVRLSGAVRGQAIICLINGILTYPGILWIGGHFDAPRLQSFALLLSVVAGTLSIIPIFGVIISTVPMVLIAWTEKDVSKLGQIDTRLASSLLVIGWISVIHAIEAYILNPYILGHSAKMNPLIVVFALLAGKHVGGLVGALLAVPIASVVVALFGYYRRRVGEMYAAESGQKLAEDTWGD